MLGSENERNAILEMSETPQPVTEHNIPENLQRGSDLCTRPTEFRARTPAFIPHCSGNKIISYLMWFASLRICETMFNITIYVVDQGMRNSNNIIILIICDKENLTSAFVGLLRISKYNLSLMQVYGTLILLLPNTQNYFISTGIKNLIIYDKVYFNSALVVYYIN